MSPVKKLNMGCDVVDKECLIEISPENNEKGASKNVIGEAPMYDLSDVSSPTDYLPDFEGTEEGFSINPVSAIFLIIHIHGFMYILFRSLEQFFIAVVPTLTLVPFMIWWYKNKMHCQLYDVFSCYADGICALGVTSMIMKIFYFANDLFGVVILHRNIHPYSTHALAHAAIGEIVKCYIYSRNVTHGRVRKQKRTMIISLIMALGFSFAESLGLVNVYFHTYPEDPSFQEIVGFMLITISLGQTLHILCGYFSGILNTIDPNAPYRPCLYTIPTRGVYFLCMSRLTVDRSFENFFITVIAGSSSILVLLYFIHFFADQMPEAHTYLSVLEYDTSEEEPLKKRVEPHFTID